MISRRTFLQGLSGIAVSGAHSARAGGAGDAGSRPWVPDDLEMRDLRVPGTFSKRLTLFLPKHLQPGETVNLLVLLHGLGETVNERAGAFAWVERYGLGKAYERLRPLVAKPFPGLAIACPFIPNVHAKGSPSLDDVTRWLIDTALPHVRAESKVIAADPARTDIDGCSLGGYLSLEIFLRRPDAFGACGGVQSAIGEASAPRYGQRFADAIGRVGPRSLYLATSSKDPFRPGNEALSRELQRRSIPHTLRNLPGPHDQAWLRETGTLDMLAWHAQR